MLLQRSFRALSTASTVGLVALAAACDGGTPTRDRGGDALSAALPPRPTGGTPVVESFSDFGGAPVDVELLPATAEERPWESRGVVLLDTGDIALLDLSFGAVTMADGADATTLAAAPEFQMRGVATPLLAAAGGATGDGAAFIYSAELEGLLAAPMEAIAPDMAILGLCPLRTSASYLDIVAVGPTQTETWRIQDRGEEALAAESLGAAPDLSADCVERLQSAASGLSISEDSAEDFVADTAYIMVEGAEIEIATLPQAGMLRVRLPGYAEPALIRLEAALNTDAANRPQRVAASSANFGGSYSGGVVLTTSDSGSVSVLALDDVIEEARRAHLEVERPQTPLERAQPPG